ncbi:MAG: hypothetical protein ACE5F1_05080 [Planctomycetota bacterium]
MKRYLVFLFLCAAALYTLTWSGRYFHDGALFAELFDQGHLLFYHTAYLPLAELLYRLLDLCGDPERETALRVLSVLSAAGAVTVSAALVARILGRNRAALFAGAVFALAPPIWFGGVTVEIHVFSAFACSLAAWLAFSLRAGLFVGPPLAILLAMSAHLTSGTLFAAYCLLGVLGEQQRGREPSPRRTLLALLATLAVGLAYLAVIATWLRPGRELHIDLGLFLTAMGDSLASVPFMARRLVSESLAPWGALVVLAFACPLLAAREQRGRTLCFVAALLPPLLFVQLSLFLEGQYWLPATFLLLLGFTAALPRRVSMPGLAAMLLLLTAQLGWSFVKERELRVDPDREWALELAAAVERPATVATADLGRTRWTKKLVTKEVFDLGHFAGQEPAEAAAFIVSKASELAARGRHVYFDRRVLFSEEQIYGAALAKALRARLGVFTLPAELPAWRLPER